MTVQLPTLTLTINTINCGGCVSAIKEGLLALDGVHHVEVDFRSKQVMVTFDKSVMDSQKLIETIEQHPHWCFVHALRKRLKKVNK